MAEYSRKVYKTDSKGKLRVLHVFTEGADMIQESGLVGGALTQHRSTCKAKNVGRSNETTPEQQARKEAEAKIETKISTGYFDSQEEALEHEVVLPMLAHPYDKHEKKIDWNNAYVQPKLDGMRALGATKMEMMSRKGKAITTMAHIQAELDALGYDDILDGELYAHGLSFQDNMKLIKKYRKDETENVCYHVYDMVLQKPFLARYGTLKNLIEMHKCEYIKIVPTYIVKSKDDLEARHAEFLAEGYEGTILRWGDAPYKINGRSANLLKFKDFHDLACKVVDIKPCEKRPTWGEPVCIHKGKTFGTGMKFSHAEREELLRNKDEYIGQIAEIRFFEYTDDGIPRFPVCVGFREDKEDGDCN